MSTSKYLECSVVDRHDLEATARQNHGWIEVRIRNVVDVPVLPMNPGEAILIVIMPEKREPPTEAEQRLKVIHKLEARRYVE